MTIDATTIAALRRETGCGMMDCKQALEEAQGDVQKAVELLRKKGEKIAAKKADRETNQGIIEAYIHPGAKVGVLVKIVCETDFVARNESFKALAHDIAMQIAAMQPRYVSSEQVPAGVVEHERAMYREQMVAEGKPAAVVEKIIEGKLQKFFSDVCLLDQTFIKDDTKIMRDVLREAIAKIGENIQVKEFARYSTQTVGVSCQ